MTKGKRHRSAITGQFVTEKEVIKRPKTTVSETIKKLVLKPKKGK